MKDITVIFVTWNRRQELLTTVGAFLHFVQYDHSKLHLHIADDNSPQPYIFDVIREFPNYHWTYSVTNRLGWGANVNLAISEAKTDYIYLNEDDYVAQSPINLKDGVRVLENVSNVGCIRYNHLIGHLGMQLRVEETEDTEGIVHYLRILKKESTFPYVYSNRPHLQHRRFWETYGKYPEGRKLGSTEEIYMSIVKGSIGPDVAILYNGTIDYLHIGKTNQLSTNDIGE